jgi:hypothetical protein
MLRTTLFIGAMMLVLLGCGPDDEEPDPGQECVDLSTDCTPQYEPTFDNIHSRTLSGSCAVAGGACHSSQGEQAGLAMEDADEAYRALTDGGRVVEGDAACSLLIRRLYSDDSSEQMPPGMPLSDGERCAIAQWIDDGAVR